MSCWCRVLVKVEEAAEHLQVGQEPDQVLETAAEPIHGPRDDHDELAGLRVLERPIKGDIASRGLGQTFAQQSSAKPHG
jgi:hypothetical protein